MGSGGFRFEDPRQKEIIERLRRLVGAFRFGVDRTYINQIEQGRRNVTVETVDKLVRGLSPTLAAVFCGVRTGLKRA